MTRDRCKSMIVIQSDGAGLGRPRVLTLRCRERSGHVCAHRSRGGSTWFDDKAGQVLGRRVSSFNVSSADKRAVKRRASIIQITDLRAARQARSTMLEARRFKPSQVG
jgi:hypothetical protein